MFVWMILKTLILVTGGFEMNSGLSVDEYLTIGSIVLRVCDQIFQGQSLRADIHRHRAESDTSGYRTESIEKVH